jgi:hypothetical protein
MVFLVVTAIGTALGTILAVEAQAWMPHLSKRLLRKAISRLDVDLSPERRGRWVEEIEADFDTYEGRPVGGLVFAIRLRLSGTKDLVRQLNEDLPSVAREEPSATEKAMSSTAFQIVFRAAVARELSELDIADLTKVVNGSTGMSLRQIAGDHAVLNDQRHRAWRLSIQERLVADYATAWITWHALLKLKRERGGSE